MAVPTSGSLSQLAMAQEALYATYGSGTVTGPISLYDMINGGNTNGSGNSYPAINTGCLPNPANRAYSSFTASIYGQTNCVNIFYSGSLGSLTNGSQLYSSNGGATNLTAGNYYVCDNITVFGCTGACATFTINSSNVVTANSNGVCCP
jgi:hypothetical protein